MVAPSLRALGAVTSGNTATPSFAAPAGAAATDVILIAAFVDDGRTTVTAVPTGFTLAPSLPQINDPTAGAPSHGLYVWWGRYAAVGVGPYTFTVSGTPFVEGRSAAIQGCITTGSPWDATSGATSGNTSVTTAPLVTATSTGTDRYAFYTATNWTSGNWTPATGFTAEWNANTRVITIDDLALPTAQTVSPQAVCASSGRSNAWVGLMLPAVTVVTGTATDTVTTSDATTRTLTAPRATADSATITDAATRTLTAPRSTADTLTVTDTAAATVILARTAADSITTTDTAARTTIAPRSTADTLTTGDAPTSRIIVTRGTADTITLTDAATGTVLPPTADLVIHVWAPRTKWATQPLSGRWQIRPPEAKWEVGVPMPVSIPAVSLEYILVPVSAVANGAAVNPTADVVQMAFTTTTGTPVPADWKTGSWDTTPVNGVYYARCLIGPAGTVTLAVGEYQVWIKITDNPEIPARPAGILQIY